MQLLRNRRAICILLGLFLIAPVAQSKLFTSTEPSGESYRVVLSARVLLPDKDPEKLNTNFTLWITLHSDVYMPDARPYYHTLNFSWSTSRSGNFTMFRSVVVEGFLDSIVFLAVHADSCLLLSRLVFPVSQVSSGWGVSFDGSDYVYSPHEQTIGISWEESLSPQVGNYSYLGCSVDSENRTLKIDFVLSASSAEKHTLDVLPLQQLDSRITFNEPDGTNLGRLRAGTWLLLTRPDMNNLSLSGSYSQPLPSLDDSPKSYDVPFGIYLNLNETEALQIGPAIVESLISSAENLMEDDNTLLNRTGVFVPDTVRRFAQARLYIDDFELQGGGGLAAFGTFPLKKAIELICQSHDEVNALVFSSNIVVAPITFVAVFILGAIASHLLFNGSKKMTVALFVAFSVLAFEVHAGLRLFVFSLFGPRPEILSLILSQYGLGSLIASLPLVVPSFALTAVSIAISLLLLSVAATLVFKYSGTATIYSLAASNAVRLIKARKLRGALTVVTVAVIAMATVPGITLKMIVPVITDVQTRPQAGRNLISISNSWSLFITISYAGGQPQVEESIGIFPMTHDEAIFNARKAGMVEYTPICIATYESPNLSGSVIFANLTFLSNYLGLELEKPTLAGDDADQVFMNERLFLSNQSVPSSLTVENATLKVAGAFRDSTLRLVNGEVLEDYLRANLLFTGVPDWSSLTSPPEIHVELPEGTSSDNESGLVGRIVLVWGPKRPIPLPIIGVADIAAVKDLPAYDQVIVVVGRCQEQEALTEIENYLRSLISTTKIALKRTRTGASSSTTADFVSSYSVTIAAGSQSKTTYVGFPVPMAFGTWLSQLILISIGSLIILSEVLNSTYERRGEAVIMSSLGASPSFITYSFVAEGLVLGIMGAFIGYFLGYAWAHWIGVSSPEIASDLYSLTPLVLVLIVSLFVTGIGSYFPAKGAILKIVPSKVMLRREVGYIKVDEDGARRVPIPLRLRSDQLGHFSSFLSNMARYYSLNSYGISVLSHRTEADREELDISYRGLDGLSERLVDYDVEIRYVPIGEFYQIELVARSPDREWTNDQKLLVKHMLYDLRVELLKITLSRQWGSH
jgi:hypothetical protein